MHLAGQRQVGFAACLQPELSQAPLRVLQQTFEPVHVALGGSLQNLPSYEGGGGNTSSEDPLQFALLADAADEGLLLVRQMDAEQFDVASLHSIVAQFVERVDFLFN